MSACHNLRSQSHLKTVLNRLGDTYQAYCNTYKSHIMATHHGGSGQPLDRDATPNEKDTDVDILHHYHHEDMCPRYILSDNGMEFKNTLMDHVLKQLDIERIFSAPYHPQSNGKLEVFHKYLKPTNWDKYINQVLASYRVTPN